MSDARKMTLGESRVRISFNPSADSMVDKIKRAAADFIDLCETLRDPSAATLQMENPKSDIGRLVMLAQTYAEDAAMWAVKAATVGK